MTQLFNNNANSKLVAGISNVSLSMQIVAGDGMKFPSPTGGDFFLATLSKITSGIESSVEIVKVTARATDVLTIVRAQEGTTALAYAEGDSVSLRVTAGVISSTEAHKNSTSNPHYVTKAQVGLGNVDNTSDASKPVSTAQAAAISAAAYTHPANHPASVITQDASNRFVTDAEKASWNAKQPAGNYATGGGTATGTNTGDQTTITGNAGTATALSTGADRTKLDGIAVGATANVGDVTLAGVQTLTNKTLTGYTETVYNLAGTDIAVANGSIQTKTLAANTTFTESLADGQSVVLGITAGSFSVTWPAITWNKVGGSGAAPTLTSTGVNWIVLWQVAGVVRGAFLGTA